MLHPCPALLTRRRPCRRGKHDWCSAAPCLAASCWPNLFTLRPAARDGIRKGLQPTARGAGAAGGSRPIRVTWGGGLRAADTAGQGTDRTYADVCGLDSSAQTYVVIEPKAAAVLPDSPHRRSPCELGSNPLASRPEGNLLGLKQTAATAAGQSFARSMGNCGRSNVVPRDPYSQRGWQ